MAGLVLFALSALLCRAEALEATMHFILKDYLHHTWRGELVSYEVDAAQVPSPAQLLGPDGQVVPVQVITRAEGRAEVAFLVEELPADR